MHGCVHGNEYCGAFSIHELARDLKLERGTVIALPVLNITGFRQLQRMSPFDLFHGGDLNRCFPGKRDGTFTEQVAYHIWPLLKEHATHFVDVHTALTPDTQWQLFAPPSGPKAKEAENMARAFGFKSTLPTPMDILPGSALIEAAKAGIPGIIVEAGGIGPAFTPEIVADSAERFRNVLRQLGMLPGKATDHGPLTFFSNFAWVNATRGGLFRPAVKCHQRIKEGDVIGHYYDVHGDVLEEKKSPFAGIVLAMQTGPVMPNGGILVHVGLDPREA
jgi:predicted deacylase